MTPELVLTGGSRTEQRRRLYETLDKLDVGESANLVTDGDADALLHQYRITRRTRLEWSVETETDGKSRVTVDKGEKRDDVDLVPFDVRGKPPQRRHELLTETFDALDPGDGFVLVNDHDPKPLYHELRSTRGEIFEWEYLKENSNEWRVAIEKTATTSTQEGDVDARFDVREIPKADRHPTIHHRYGNIPDGGTMEIVAQHEPEPLQREFRARYGDSFSWDVLEDEPGRCRVQITKEVETDGASGESTPSSPAADSLAITEELDVRDLPPTERHEQIYDAYDDLDSGEAFVLVNDHDPKPLYHQFEAEAGPEFRWEYKNEDPGEFRVRIGKA